MAPSKTYLRLSSTRLPLRHLLSASIIWLILPNAYIDSALARSTLPHFNATALNGEVVASDKLIGRPTILIITASRDAGESTRRWVNALYDGLDPKNYFVRDVLAIDLPFFMSEADAIDKAKEAVPKRYHDKTWILDSTVLEEALGIPRDSAMACIIVLDPEGQIIARVHGTLNKKRLKTIIDAAQTLK